MKTMNLDLTMENVTKLAEEIVKTHSVTMQEAMDLAEFRIRYAGMPK